jgi:hypothetical protein
MQNQGDEQKQTGTRNETYDLISVLYHALQGAENCKTYANDAKDSQLRDFFNQALNAQRQLADQGKEVLQKCLQKEQGGQSAFGWGSSKAQGGSSPQSSSQGQSQGQSAFAHQGSGPSGGANAA